MTDMSKKTTPAPAPAGQDEPVGNPPCGGSWRWINGRYERSEARQARPEQPSEE